MDALISVATGLVGTLVGAAIAWLAGKRLHRLKTAYDMHREFHSSEMTHSRNLGGVTVRKHEDVRWQASRNIASLQVWLYENTDRNQYKQWVRRANKMQDPIARGLRAPSRPTSRAIIAVSRGRCRRALRAA
jgi:hypothetical protein